MENINILNRSMYSSLVHMGNCFDLWTGQEDGNLESIQSFVKSKTLEWYRYNPRKSIERYGISCTSLNGEIESPHIDLDSILEYNRENGTTYTELSFDKPTKYYSLIQPWIHGLEPHICRSHILKLKPGAFFPIHRDIRRVDIISFRLFLPILNCNLPQMAFILDDKIQRFDHGRLYFINTSLSHALTNFSMKDSIFGVINVKLNEDSVRWVMKNVSAQ